MILYKFALIIDQSVLTVEAFFAKAPYLRLLACSFNIYTHVPCDRNIFIFIHLPCLNRRTDSWGSDEWIMELFCLLKWFMAQRIDVCVLFWKTPFDRFDEEPVSLCVLLGQDRSCLRPPRKHRLNATLVHHLAKLLLKSTTSPGCLLRERVSC